MFVINFTASLLLEHVPGGTEVDYIKYQSEYRASDPFLFKNFIFAIFCTNHSCCIIPCYIYIYIYIFLYILLDTALRFCFKKNCDIFINTEKVMKFEAKFTTVNNKYVTKSS